MLNGAQVSSLKDIVIAVANGALPRSSGVEMIVLAFQLERDAAERVLGAAGDSFVPAAAPVPAQ